MIVLFEKNANGKIEFTKEELEELLEKARQEGVREGSKPNYIYTTPPSTTPINPLPYQVTCTSGTVATSDSAPEVTKLNGAPITNGI